MSEFASERGTAANEDVATPISAEEAVDDREPAAPTADDIEDSWED